MLYHAKLVLGVFDAPAKASVYVKSCLTENLAAPHVCILENVWNIRIYLRKKYPLRTHTEDAMEAMRTGTGINGVLGISPLADSIDYVNSVPVDYVHPVLEGVTRMLMNLWFNSSNHRSPFIWAIKFLKLMQYFSSNVHAPHEIIHRPRSRSYWKASELKNWLLIYSLPLLQGYLPPLYLHHFALFMCAVHILVQ